jgi:hypothetical protein
MTSQNLSVQAAKGNTGSGALTEGRFHLKNAVDKGSFEEGSQLACPKALVERELLYWQAFCVDNSRRIGFLSYPAAHGQELDFAFN